METTIKKTCYQLKSIPSNAQLNIFYNPEVKNEEYFIKAIAEYDKLKADNEALLNIAKEYYMHLQKAANENVKNAISTDSQRAYLRNTISRITGIECAVLQNEIESEAIQKAETK